MASFRPNVAFYPRLYSLPSDDLSISVFSASSPSDNNIPIDKVRRWQAADALFWDCARAMRGRMKGRVEAKSRQGLSGGSGSSQLGQLNLASSSADATEGQQDVDPAVSGLAPPFRAQEYATSSKHADGSASPIRRKSSDGIKASDSPPNAKSHQRLRSDEIMIPSSSTNGNRAFASSQSPSKSRQWQTMKIYIDGLDGSVKQLLGHHRHPDDPILTNLLHPHVHFRFVQLEYQSFDRTATDPALPAIEIASPGRPVMYFRCAKVEELRNWFASLSTWRPLRPDSITSGPSIPSLSPEVRASWASINSPPPSVSLIRGPEPVLLFIQRENQPTLPDLKYELGHISLRSDGLFVVQSANPSNMTTLCGIDVQSLDRASIYKLDRSAVAADGIGEVLVISRAGAQMSTQTSQEEANPPPTSPGKSASTRSRAFRLGRSSKSSNGSPASEPNPTLYNALGFGSDENLVNIPPAYIRMSFDRPSLLSTWLVLLRCCAKTGICGRPLVKPSRRTKSNTDLTSLAASGTPTLGAGSAPSGGSGAVCAGGHYLSRRITLRVMDAQLNGLLPVDATVYDSDSDTSGPHPRSPRKWSQDKKDSGLSGQKRRDRFFGVRNGSMVEDERTDMSVLSFFVELELANELRVRTGTKHQSKNPFWGENCAVGEVPMMSVNRANRHSLGVAAESLIPRTSLGGGKIRAVVRQRIEKNSAVVGYVDILLDTFSRNAQHEQWYTLTTGDANTTRDNNPELKNQLRLGILIEEDVILPINELEGMLTLLRDFRNDLSIDLAKSLPDLERFATDATRVLAADGSIEPWLAYLGQKELHACAGQTSTLLRGNTLFTKAMDALMKLVGHEFLEESIGLIIRRLMEENVVIEIDPSKIELGADLHTNKQRMIIWTMAIWKNIERSAGQCPPILRRLFATLAGQVAARFPGDQTIRQTSISGFLFLRFFCPAVVNPKLFGLTKDYPRPAVQRTLTLLAKCLQGLANKVVKFSKEPWMEIMNPFILEQSEAFSNFIDLVSTPSDDLPIGSDQDMATSLTLRLPTEYRVGMPYGPYLLNLVKDLSCLAAYVTRSAPSPGSAIELRETGIEAHFRVVCREIAEQGRAQVRASHPERPLSAAVPWMETPPDSPLRGPARTIYQMVGKRDLMGKGSDWSGEGNRASEIHLPRLDSRSSDSNKTSLPSDVHTESTYTSTNAAGVSVSVARGVAVDENYDRSQPDPSDERSNRLKSPVPNGTYGSPSTPTATRIESPSTPRHYMAYATSTQF